MSTEIKKVFPPRQWNQKESADFEEFVRLNGPEIRRIFIKFGIIQTQRS